MSIDVMAGSAVLAVFKGDTNSDRAPVKGT